MPNNDASKKAEVHEGNIVHPTSVDELPDELKAKLQAKMEAVTRAFLDSCVKDRHDRVEQFKELIINEPAAAETSNVEVINRGKPIYDDSYPQHADYSVMLDGHKKVIDSELKSMRSDLRNVDSKFDKIMTRFDRLEGKEPSIEDEYEYDMPASSYDDQANNACNKGKSVQSEADKTDYTNRRQLVRFAENSDRNQRTDIKQ